MIEQHAEAKLNLKSLSSVSYSIMSLQIKNVTYIITNYSWPVLKSSPNSKCKNNNILTKKIILYYIISLHN